MNAYLQMCVLIIFAPSTGSLWIPAGILQQPFFDYKNTDAQNYGSVGTILGHEMSVSLATNHNSSCDGLAQGTCVPVVLTVQIYRFIFTVTDTR
jgi:hypothetical protein